MTTPSMRVQRYDATTRHVDARQEPAQQEIARYATTAVTLDEFAAAVARCCARNDAPMSR